MAQYAMTDEQITNFDYAFNRYVEFASPITQIIPWVDSPVAYGEEFYYPAKPAQPTVGKLFDYEKQAEIQYTALTDKSAAIWLDLEIPDVDRRILASTSMNVENAWGQLAAMQLMKQVAHTVYMGDTVTEFTGLFGSASYTSTYATIGWNTALGPHSTISDMLFNAAADLWANGFTPPYVCVLSTNLKYGTTVTINAAPVADITNGDMMLNILNGNKSGDTSRLFFEHIGTNSPDLNVVYPFETATTNDGRALVMKPVQNGVNYVEGRWMQRPHSTDWTFDAKTDRWHTRIKCMIALRVLDTNAIAAHTTIDLVL